MNGGFGGPSLSVSQLRGAPALLVGGRGAWLVDHRFALGGAVSGLLPQAGQEGRLRLGYGGPWLGYLLLPEQPLHAFVGALLGIGWVSQQKGEGEATTLDWTLAAEPTVGVELNVLPFLRVGASVSYRLLGNAPAAGLRMNELSGLAGTLHLQFGAF